MTEELTQLSEDDTVAVTIDGSEYRGVVSYAYHEEAEYADGIPIPGALEIDLSLTAESLNKHNLPTEQIDIRAKERRPGSWDAAKATVYDPVVDDEGYVVSDEHRTLGTVHSVEVLSDD